MSEEIGRPGPDGASVLVEDVGESPEDAGRLNGASRGRLVSIIATMVLFSEIVPFQYSMVAAVVPKIAVSFPAAGSSVSWTMTILGVAGGATMALVGKAADLYGKKRVFLLASLFFLVGSLICALTGSWALFLLGRGLQSVSLGLSAVSYGLVRDLMPRHWIPLCVGFLGTGFGVAGIAGPLVCGALMDHFSWRSVFWFLVIYMLVTIPLFARTVPETPVRVRQRFDVVGALLFGAGVGAVLIYASEAAGWGWGNAGSLAYLFGGLLALVAFVLWERRVPDPMVELSLLRSPRVSIVLAISFFCTGAFSATGYVVAYMFETPKPDALKAQLLQGAAEQGHVPASTLAPFVTFQGDIGYAAGFSVLQLAVHITMWTAVFMMVFGPIGGILCRKVGARLPLLIGTVAILAACLLWVRWHTTWQEQVAIGVLLGLGSGFFYAACPNLIMDAVPARRQGVSAGMLAVFGGIGGATGTALLTPLLTNHPFRMVVTTPGHAPVVTDIPQVFTDAGFTQVYLFVGCIGAALALLLVVALRTGRTPARGGQPA